VIKKADQIVHEFQYDVLSEMTWAMDHNEGWQTHTVDLERKRKGV